MIWPKINHFESNSLIKFALFYLASKYLEKIKDKKVQIRHNYKYILNSR